MPPTATSSSTSGPYSPQPANGRASRKWSTPTPRGAAGAASDTGPTANRASSRRPTTWGTTHEPRRLARIADPDRRRGTARDGQLSETGARSRGGGRDDPRRQPAVGRGLRDAAVAPRQPHAQPDRRAAALRRPRDRGRPVRARDRPPAGRAS